MTSGPVPALVVVAVVSSFLSSLMFVMEYRPTRVQIDVGSEEEVVSRWGTECYSVVQPQPLDFFGSQARDSSVGITGFSFLIFKIICFFVFYLYGHKAI